MTACPACAGYTYAERRAIDRAGRQHHAALDALRQREADRRTAPPFAGWDRVDAAAWSPS